MKRREFITGLGGIAAATRFAAQAQPPAMPVIGILGSASPDQWAVRLRAFRQGLAVPPAILVRADEIIE